MEYDYDRAEAKLKELEGVAEQAILNFLKDTNFSGDTKHAQQIAAKVINQLVKVTPPEKEDYGKIHFITLQQSGYGGARSVKAGNILLNMPKLITTLAGGVLTVAGAVEAPWTALFAAIVVWDSVWSGLTVELSEREAVTLWTLWKNRDESNCVPEAELLDKVNDELSSSGRSPISQTELNSSLEVLRKMSCISRSKSDNSKWWLREWVRVSYK